MSEVHTAAKKLRIARLNDDALWRVSLDSPKGNIIDSTLTLELTEFFRAVEQEHRLRAVVLTGEGDDFCYGASIEEHRPDRVAKMLADFHELFRQIARAGVPVLAAVRGKCLGGGLELAAFCHRIFAHPEARFGQPEVKLGVFAPVGSAILADRVGRAAAEDLLLTGRVVKCETALAMRLVDVVDEHPEGAALAWAEKYLQPRSASSLRFATRAARLEFMARFERTIADLEHLYLDELMSTQDATEGLEAFLAKRDPKWRDS